MSDAEAATRELSSQLFRVALERAFRKVHNTLKGSQHGVVTVM